LNRVWQELLSQQQQAQQHMQQLVSDRQCSQLSVGSGSDSGAAGLLSGMVDAIAGGGNCWLDWLHFAFFCMYQQADRDTTAEELTKLVHMHSLH